MFEKLFKIWIIGVVLIVVTMFLVEFVNYSVDELYNTYVEPYVVSETTSTTSVTTVESVTEMIVIEEINVVDNNNNVVVEIQ